MSSPEHSPPPGRGEPLPSARANRVARLAAVGALIVSVVFLLFVLSFVEDDPTGLALAFVWVFVIAFCGWFLVTRRGYRRFLVLPAILWALINLLGFAWDHKVVLPTLIGVLALFGLAARYAVRHVHTRAHGTGRYARAAEPGRKCVLIINPKSGGGKAELFNLPEEARKRGIHPLVLGPGDSLCEMADRAVTQGADVIGMAGGDGSQALVASVAMQRDVAHICVPAGTRNHFALDLGLDRDDVVGSLDAFTDGVERRIDLASLNERIFVNNASLGIYAQVVQSDSYRDGKLGTWKRMLPEMLGRDAVASDLLFDAPHAQDWANASLVMVSNNPYQLRRFRGAGTRPRLDTGRLGIFATRMRGAGSVAKLVTLGTIGQHRRLGGVLQWSCLEFEVRASAPVAVGLDGEALVLTPPLRFVSLPRALRVRVPRHATGLSPAGGAVTLTRRHHRHEARQRARAGQFGCGSHREAGGAATGGP
jgi:diacylglycerol kinase family enzyme